MTSRNKIYFVSDVHLGAPALSNNFEREKLFVRWLEEISHDAEMIFLMGDIFDFWFEYKRVAPRGFVRVLGKIAEITDKGIPLHFFTGNHDVWVFDYLPAETGVIVHREPFETEIKGKRFYLAHGDGLNPSDKGYLLIKALFHNRTAQWLFARLHPNFALGLAHRWSKHSRLANGVEGARFMGEEREEQISYARKLLNAGKQFDYFIFGHRHLALEYNLNDESKLYLLGEWIREYSYGVFDGTDFRLERIHNAPPTGKN